MTVDVSDRRPAPIAASRLGIADCDIHPARASQRELYPFLETRWQRHLETFGARPYHGMQVGPAYPKGQPMACRRDAWPENGGPPGSDLATMQRQHLDPNNVELGILNPLSPSGQGIQDLDLSAALTRAVNDWQVAAWTSRDARLRASVVIPYEDAAASVAEIERRAGDANFAQVLILSRTAEPLGRRRYWPIFEAAARAGLPVAVHAFGYGGFPVTSSGWPSFYMEEMVGHAQCQQALLSSMVLEGVFERVPGLKVVLVEAGFAWLPSLAWRLDKAWGRLRQETPVVRRPPSEYIREHVWLTTQPMEEPDAPRHLAEVVEWIGPERLLFATDYPHWDYDDPAASVPIRLEETAKRGLFRENARAVYGR